MYLKKNKNGWRSGGSGIAGVLTQRKSGLGAPLAEGHRGPQPHPPRPPASVDMRPGGDAAAGLAVVVSEGGKEEGTQGRK